MKKLNKKDILLIIAMEEESNNKFETLDIDLIYTGIGKINATYYLTKELIKRKLNNNLPKYVVNLGSCGSKKFKKGELVACNKFIQRDMDCSSSTHRIGETPREKEFYVIEHEKFIDNLAYGICGTGDSFATEPCSIEAVDLYEMEAYALAKVCKLEGVNFISIKYITDGLDSDGNKDWHKNITCVSESLFEYFKKLI